MVARFIPANTTPAKRSSKTQTASWSLVPIARAYGTRLLQAPIASAYCTRLLHAPMALKACMHPGKTEGQGVSHKKHGSGLPVS